MGIGTEQGEVEVAIQRSSGRQIQKVGGIARRSVAKTEQVQNSRAKALGVQNIDRMSVARQIRCRAVEQKHLGFRT